MKNIVLLVAVMGVNVCIFAIPFLNKLNHDFDASEKIAIVLGVVIEVLCLALIPAAVDADKQTQ